MLCILIIDELPTFTPENNALFKMSWFQPTRNPLTKTDELTTTNEQKTQFNNTLSQLLCNPIVSLAHTSRVHSVSRK